MRVEVLIQRNSLRLSSPLSAATSLSSAAESATSNDTTAQSVTHPPPRSITEQAGNRWEEALLVIGSHGNVGTEVRTSYPFCVSVPSWSLCWCVPLSCSSWSLSFWQQSCGKYTVRAFSLSNSKAREVFASWWKICIVIWFHRSSVSFPGAGDLAETNPLGERRNGCELAYLPNLREIQAIIGDLRCFMPTLLPPTGSRWPAQSWTHLSQQEARPGLVRFLLTHFLW